MYVEHRLSVRETARRLGVHENTIRNWEAKGLLRATRLPASGYRRFDAAEVDRMRNDMLNNAAPAVGGPEHHVTRPIRIVHGDDT
jgi:excisionase family DNA binding protein